MVLPTLAAAVIAGDVGEGASSVNDKLKMAARGPEVHIGIKVAAAGRRK